MSPVENYPRFQDSWHIILGLKNQNETKQNKKMRISKQLKMDTETEAKFCDNNKFCSCLVTGMVSFFCDLFRRKKEKTAVQLTRFGGVSHCKNCCFWFWCVLQEIYDSCAVGRSRKKPPKNTERPRHAHPSSSPQKAPMAAFCYTPGENTKNIQFVICSERQINMQEYIWMPESTFSAKKTLFIGTHVFRELGAWWRQAFFQLILCHNRFWKTAEKTPNL